MKRARDGFAVVERYDGDGVDDMPGLVYPVYQFGLEREFTGFWPGTADDHVRLLRIAYPAIHAADSDAQVLLIAILAADIFNGAPDAAEIERRFQETPKACRNLSDMQTVLSACDAYDVVDFHSLGDYTEIPVTAAWLREQVQAHGCDKPLYIGDALSMSCLIGYGDPFEIVPPLTFAPATDAARDSVIAVLQSVADPAKPDHDTATAWLQAEMARGLVKKIVVAAGEGIEGINLGNLEDWTLVNALDANAALVRSTGAAAFMGMMDTTLTARYAGLPLNGSYAATSKVRNPGDARAAFYALQLALDKIARLTTATKLDLGTDVWVYRFETPTGSVWVVWYDDGALYLPGDPAPAKSVSLTVNSARIQVTTTPATADTPDAVEMDGGTVSLTVDSTPKLLLSCSHEPRKSSRSSHTEPQRAQGKFGQSLTDQLRNFTISPNR